MNNEPVAWMSQGGDVTRSKDYFVEMGFTDLIPLYTHPVKELTDEEITEICIEGGMYDCINDPYFKPNGNYSLDLDLIRFAREILRKAQEK